MKIKNTLPPIYDALVKAGMRPSADTIYAYGDTIYVPSGQHIPEDLIVHEETHCKQQAGDPDAWWSRYIDDPYFRIDQEVEAYANQYRYVCRNMIRDRNARARFLTKLSSVLSGPVYGNVILQSVAFKRIKKLANISWQTATINSY